ncbi:MAG: hypothetical protein E6Q27_01020 [Aeromicrobium sp.]|nr:MAG: hypothetical protein E6Q27_01020 [Aeromicrobium sp.]
METARSLTAIGSQLLDKARSVSAGRSSDTVFGGAEHSLRQTMIALTAGSKLADHESPGDATLHVLVGSVVLTGGPRGDVAGSAGDLLVIPNARHGLVAESDAVVLLTVAKTPHLEN